MNASVDVAIIGAGISGLALALQLVATGHHVVVFEARDRVGGRLHSIDGLDLGATWFWPNEPRVHALLSELDVPTHAQFLAGDATYHDANGTQRLQGNPIDVPSGRFVSGADSLTRAIVRDLPEGTVRLGTAVTAIARTAEGVTLTTNDDTVAGRAVVIALPPALAIDSITVEPPLPATLVRTARNTPVWMGGITKVVIRYPHAFWRSAGLSGSGISHVGPMREVHDMSGVDGHPGALFGFVPAGSVGDATVTEGAIVDQLTAMFGRDARNPDAVHICDWRGERFTSPPGVELLTNYEMFGHAAFQDAALDGRLFWTSTETSRTFPGHIEGALVAAERTAGQLTDRLHLCTLMKDT